MKHLPYKFLLLLLSLSFFIQLKVAAQPPTSFNSDEIYLQMQKLKVLGSVLYIAAHPDDENTRLLTYFSLGLFSIV